MTIDEAQIMLKAKAKCIERICKGIYEDCNEQKCDNCDLCYAQGTNGEQIELMLQCAEWLEELKAIKSDGFTDNLLDMGFTKGYNKALEELKVIKEMDLSIPQHFTKEQSDWIKKYCINRNKEFYNKALDDFVKFANTMPTVEEDDGTTRPMWLEEMAERLKEQEK